MAWCLVKHRDNFVFSFYLYKFLNINIILGYLKIWTIIIHLCRYSETDAIGLRISKFTLELNIYSKTTNNYTNITDEVISLTQGPLAI